MVKNIIKIKRMLKKKIKKQERRRNLREINKVRYFKSLILICFILTSYSSFSQIDYKKDTLIFDKLDTNYDSHRTAIKVINENLTFIRKRDTKKVIILFNKIDLDYTYGEWKALTTNENGSSIRGSIVDSLELDEITYILSLRIKNIKKLYNAKRLIHYYDVENNDLSWYSLLKRKERKQAKKKAKSKSNE
jgi:hypothetical protein